MLQAVGRVDLPVKLLAVGLVVKVALNYFLVGIPEINVMGAGIGTLVCYGLLTVLALYFLCKRARITPNLVGLFLKPFLAGGICVTAAYFVQLFAAKVISGKIATCIAIVVAAAVYVVCMLWFKALNRGDIMMLPKGEKIAKILEKHGWIR